MGKTTFVLLLVLTVVVVYQLYSILLQQEGSVKPLDYSSKLDRKQQAAGLVNDLPKAPDARNSSRKGYVEYVEKAHNNTIKSPINVLYSESAVSK